MNKVIVTKLRREAHGELEANLTISGMGRSMTLPVTRLHGSWGTLPDETGRWQVILPHFAAELQERAKKFERAEARNATS